VLLYSRDHITAQLRSKKAQLVQLWGGKPAQAARDGPPDTLHNTLHFTISM